MLTGSFSCYARVETPVSLALLISYFSVHLPSWRYIQKSALAQSPQFSQQIQSLLSGKRKAVAEDTAFPIGRELLTWAREHPPIWLPLGIFYQPPL